MNITFLMENLSFYYNDLSMQIIMSPSLIKSLTSYFFFKVPVKSKLNLFTLLAHITSLVVNN